MRYGWLVLVLGATACADGGGSDDTDTDTDTTSTDDTTDDDTTDDDTTDDDTTDDTDVEETDVDTDPPGDTNPPTPLLTEAPDYTYFYDGTAVNIYWKAASDDVTAPADLEYRASCQPSGGSVTSTSWTKPAGLTTEGSGRWWVVACPGTEGTYDLWVEVRDEAGNSASYPTLTAEVLGEVIVGPK